MDDLDQGIEQLPDAVPDVILEWLQANRIPLAPEQRDTSIWAEWDPIDRLLHLGWWGETVCENCGQSDRPERSLIVPRGFTDNNWQHGCGVWWRPYEGVAVVPADVNLSSSAVRAELVVHLDEELADMRRAQDDVVDMMRKALAKELAAFLHTYTDDEDRAEQARGSEIQPGIWRNDSGRWEIWVYDPRADEDTITVDEDDPAVATQKAEAAKRAEPMTDPALMLHRAWKAAVEEERLKAAAEEDRSNPT
jgi:hypothetical protein